MHQTMSISQLSCCRICTNSSLSSIKLLYVDGNSKVGPRVCYRSPSKITLWLNKSDLYRIDNNQIRTSKKSEEFTQLLTQVHAQIFLDKKMLLCLNHLLAMQLEVQQPFCLMGWFCHSTSQLLVDC